jgi:hypothetical protein
MTYPSGTKKLLKKHGHTYCLDQNDNVIGELTSRRTSEPAPPGAPLDTLCRDFSQLAIPSSNGYTQQLPAENLSSPRKNQNTYHGHTVGSPGRGRSGPQNSDLGTTPTPKKFNAPRIRGGTTYRDNELDKRKCLTLVDGSQSD